MRTKNAVALLIAFVLTVAAVLAFFTPTLGLTPVQDQLSLGLDLRGGIYTVFQAGKGEYSSSEFEDLLDATCTVLRNRLTDRGYTEANVMVQGEDCIRIEIPDIDDPRQVIELVGTPAHLEFLEPNGNCVIEGKDIKSVKAELNTTEGGYEVAFVLTDKGGDAFAEATGRLIGRTISIVLDGEVISAPQVNSRISGGRGVITLGGGSMEDAENLASLIRSGALPLDIDEIETRAISATLGEEAIDRALLAGIIGMALVVVFMLIVYRLPGLMADIALVWYITIVFGLIALFGIQLTLPGIAGILLGIGMAVDANVVIFERFREELYAGRSGESAVKAGFKHALTAIIDSNVTTLIAAFVLMLFGTGSVKGFSYTLALSVIVSMFTAVFVNRFLLTRAVRLGLTNRSLYARRLTRRGDRNITGWFRKVRWVPAVLAAAALVFCLTGNGLRLGLDFTGGTLLEYSVGEEFRTEDVKEVLAACGYKETGVTKAEDAQGGMTNVQITLTLEEETVDLRACAEKILNGSEARTQESVRILDEQTAEELGFGREYVGAYELIYLSGEDGDNVRDGLTDGLEQAHCPFAAVHVFERDDDPGERRLAVYVLPAEGNLQARNILDAALAEKYPGIAYVSMEHAGAVSSASLVKNALLSLAVALALMLIYIALRFDFHSGAAALIGLAHDMTIMFCAMCLFGRFYQINSPFIAALLTIVGYSINDTIVIFDRIRENKKRMQGAPYNEIVDRSVTASLTRTINTTVTTLFTLVSLYVLGVDSIREFTFPLLAGMLAGAFSSNLINGPVWALLMTRRSKKRTAEQKAE